MNLLLIIAFAFLNSFRGQSSIHGGRVLSCIGFGIVTWLYGTSFFIAVAVALGIYFWAIWRWGRGFTSFQGDNVLLSFSNGIKPVDFVAKHLSGFDVDRNWQTMTPEEIRLYGTIWMCIRGLFLYPLFVWLAWYRQDPFPLFVGLCSLSQGMVYHVIGWNIMKGSPYGVRYAEIVYGAIIGWMILVCL